MKTDKKGVLKVLMALFFLITLLFMSVLFIRIEEIHSFALTKKNVTIKATDITQVYGENEESLTYIITGDSLTDGERTSLNVSLSKAEGGDVGNYSIIVSYTEVENITVVVENGNYRIVPKIFDTGSVIFENAEYTYDGGRKALSPQSEIPAEISVEYSANNQSQAGQYLVSAIFSCPSGNYIVTGGIVYATLTINKAKLDINGISFSNGSYPYDGEIHRLALSGSIPQNISVRYLNNRARNAGTYRVSAVLDYDKKNYDLYNGEYALTDNTLYADLTVLKGKSVIKLNKSEYEKKYDGTAVNIDATVTGEDSNNMVFTVNGKLSTNRFVDVGRYVVEITTIGNVNYYPADKVYAEVNILNDYIVSVTDDAQLMVIFEDGYRQGTSLVVDSTKISENVGNPKFNEKVVGAYYISAVYNGKAVNEGQFSIVLVPPKGENLKIYQIENGVVTSVEYEINSQGNLVFNVKKLGRYVVYADNYSMYWLIGLMICLIAIVVMLICLAIYRSKKFKLCYETNVLEKTLPSIDLKEGENIVLHKLLATNRIFEGWYYDKDFCYQADINHSMPRQDVKLYAKWSYKPYLSIGKIHKFTDADIFKDFYD